MEESEMPRYKLRIDLKRYFFDPDGHDYMLPDRSTTEELNETHLVPKGTVVIFIDSDGPDKAILEVETVPEGNEQSNAWQKMVGRRFASSPNTFPLFDLINNETD